MHAPAPLPPTEEPMTMPPGVWAHTLATARKRPVVVVVVLFALLWIVGMMYWDLLGHRGTIAPLFVWMYTRPAVPVAGFEVWDHRVCFNDGIGV